ncbi:acyl-CoA transferase [Thioclava sp. SK-1]|uniref:CoA transferase n=1 Tax=Thioclava sp. SK-1 TaxID=1889770 RepID=UPI0008252BCD|nr:CoA transferase [Thioclava sp. SK-1]OCX65440.1 acyl-CoA transferase [Thioclava sp. SK-1]
MNMVHDFTQQIDEALDAAGGARSHVAVTEKNPAALPSCFDVSELAIASVRAAAMELAALEGADEITLDRRLALMWFSTTLRPQGWDLPSLWDPIAGNYRAADGWVRLHTNAPHHRDAALGVLGCPAEREATAAAVRDWAKDALEESVVAAGGAAAAMRGLADWADHPQGRAVAAEPLMAWQAVDAAPRPVVPPGLKAVRVLDLTRVLAGPVATRFLAGFGADVLRIDPPWWSEPGVEPEVTLGKRRAGLDLRRAGDRNRFEALLAGADVLVHGYRPCALDGLGLGDARRREIAPALIEVSLDAYGWTGPWAGRRGFDSLVQMSCGIAEEGMRRTQAASPVPLPVQALDHATGYLMAAAVLRALRLRHNTGAVSNAHLSLARTATLLTGAGAFAMEGDGINESPVDLAPEIEATGWGLARRLRFPVEIGGRAPRWHYAAGPLRIDAPAWAE